MNIDISFFLSVNDMPHINCKTGLKLSLLSKSQAVLTMMEPLGNDLSI